MSNPNYIDRLNNQETTPFSNYSTIEDSDRTSLEEGNQRIPQTSVIDNSSGGRNKSREAVVTPSTTIRSHDPYLAQAKDIEISNIDRQEGYDANLVNLQPRTTAQSEVETGILSSTNNHDVSTKKTRKVELPYDSRDPNEEITEEETKNGTNNNRRNGRKQRMKKKPLVWYKKPLNWLLGGLLFLVILGLAIGLGVGLSNHHHNNVVIVAGANPSKNPNITVSNSVPLVSNSGGLPTAVPVTTRITPALAITTL